MTPLESRIAALCSPAIVPGLARTRSLLRLLGHPEKGIPVIHVAGSNAKGSVCRMLESVLVEAGHRTGMFISPHLVDFTERFRVGGKQAKRADLERAAAKLWPALREQALHPEGAATYFEALTALAFLYFKQQRVRVLVLETGLGGRLDSTNVIAHPVLSVITNISLEHTQILGKTEARIAWEKAGIIKKGTPLVTGATGDARRVIVREFKKVQGRGRTPLLALQPRKDWAVLADFDAPEQQSQTIILRHLDDKHVITLPLLGAHQHENLAVALAALKLLAPKFWLSQAAILRGLARADWPGRLEVSSTRPLTILDGAHNPAGAKALAAYVAQLQGRRRFARTAFVLGVLKDKDWRKMMRAWSPLADRFFTAMPPDPRGLEADLLSGWLRGQGSAAEATQDLRQALARARRWAGPQGLVVAAGSLYSVGALLKLRSR
jgi:dihydrofolate synthase/folylpolyglutamate synthase